MTLDLTGYADTVESGLHLGSRAVGKKGRRHRRGIAMIDAVPAFGDAEIATRWLERNRRPDHMPEMRRREGDAHEADRHAL